MEMVAIVLAALVALLHVYILVLEMFFWTKPLGRKAFGLKADFAEQSKALAANQGLYNGFLAAGLFWGLMQGAAGAGRTTSCPGDSATPITPCTALNTKARTLASSRKRTSRLAGWTFTSTAAGSISRKTKASG